MGGWATCDPMACYVDRRMAARLSALSALRALSCLAYAWKEIVMSVRLGLLALTLFLLSTPAHSETGNELLQECEALERGARLSGDKIQLPERTDVHRCWGYMSAVQDFSVILADYPRGKPLLNSCPGPDTTLMQFIRVFTNYARTHPQELHLKASQLIYRAM